jgi:hypothetical protein
MGFQFLKNQLFSSVNVDMFSKLTLESLKIRIGNEIYVKFEIQLTAVVCFLLHKTCKKKLKKNFFSSNFLQTTGRRDENQKKKRQSKVLAYRISPKTLGLALHSTFCCFVL